MTARVLILDEDPVLCDLYRTVLEDEGYEGIVAQALPEIDMVIRLQPDLILLDYFYGSTPHGWIFLIQLKTYVETDHIPVLLCTSDVAAVNAHAHDLATFNVNVVHKPFDLNDFLAAVRYSLPSDRAASAPLNSRARNGSTPAYKRP
ncbi:MAG TPA: response regulator [Herpetosiphonaceae bacterium]